MKLRTEIKIAHFVPGMEHGDRVLALGSCFAELVSGRLAGAKFKVTSNPTGILFNPLSIAAAIENYVSRRVVPREELRFGHGLWFHDDFHGSFSSSTPEAALLGMNVGLQAGTNALRESDRVIVTFGTAWVYEREGRVVANCHKQAAACFQRRRSTVEQIVERFSSLLDGPLKEKLVIFSVSPVRHVGDGLEENSIGKAVLRLAVAELCERHANARYFPAFEILMDDLRDYRFYADDLVHLSSQAAQYIWERFVECALSDGARALLPRIEAIMAATRHRPLHPDGEEFRAFCRRQLEAIAALPEVDFRAEKARFEREITNF